MYIAREADTLHNKYGNVAAMHSNIFLSQAISQTDKPTDPVLTSLQRDQLSMLLQKYLSPSVLNLSSLSVLYRKDCERQVSATGSSHKAKYLQLPVTSVKHRGMLFPEREAPDWQTLRAIPLGSYTHWLRSRVPSSQRQGRTRPRLGLGGSERLWAPDRREPEPDPSPS